MRENVLKSVCKLECVDVAQAVLHVCIDNKLGQSKDLAAEMERVSEARLLALLRSESPEGEPLFSAWNMKVWTRMN